MLRLCTQNIGLL